MVLGRFWEGLGTVLGGFWQGLGAFWVLLGIAVFCWAFLGHAGFCWRHHECFPGRVITNAFLGFAFAKLCCGFPRLCRKYCVLLGFSGLCWALLGRLITNVFQDMSSQMLLRVSTTPTHYRSSRSFAKTGFFLGVMLLLFCCFFCVLF